MKSAKSRYWRRVVSGAAATVALVVGTGCSDDAPDRDTASAAPTRVVATVGGEQITAAQLERHANLLRNGRAGGGDMDALRKEALPKLLLQAAVMAEAKRQDVTVSRARLRRQVNAVKARYPNARAFREFLGGLSQQDLLDQLTLAALSEKLVAAARSDGEDPESFVDSLPRRWKGRTDCAPAYSDVPGCR